MSAFVHWAGQHQFPSRHRQGFFRSVAAVKREQNRHAAFLTANAEIPSHVDLGPSRNIQLLFCGLSAFRNSRIRVRLWSLALRCRSKRARSPFFLDMPLSFGFPRPEVLRLTTRT